MPESPLPHKLSTNNTTTNSLSGVGGGDYSVIIKDANGCALIENVSIFSPCLK